MRFLFNSESSKSKSIPKGQNVGTISCMRFIFESESSQSKSIHGQNPGVNNPNLLIKISKSIPIRPDMRMQTFKFQN